ncbi:helix-turn-helix domain-containing protein [Prevotella copri]|uniref:Helix-turn-helix domain-containing protein n=1 Tax=Segatella copri TaxID=165179 RepID=A0AAW5IFH2_9BACT|nr:helix-turn-helix domain-containing protein [Segatella copri]MCP9533304.1 helix-turn-helix domain-containing protein [Segatella copri]MCP9536002.1 helix-turn-helix domain-containing protein [Segatella copri]MCP9538906.1 helix-turn-helix domain-containing protein [Segatella copri]MCP9557293.1 helix-turn-helix domain-containing protein [Segatella copri]MCP9560301.1 helix-turn-helix domain-containing protein [Segatella copri]
MELSELSSQQEASLFLSGLEEWQEGPQVLTYGAILICRKGKARLNVNYKDWELYEGAVITLFPNDVVELKVDGDCKSPQTENGDCKSPETENGDCKSPQTANSFQAEILKYNPSLLREASLQLEQTVYSSLREDRCRQDTPVVTNIINGMFGLLKVYFDQSECTCISQLVLCQLKAFFVGFHEYLQRNPQYRPDEVKSYRVRELFNRFMMLLERDYKISRDVNYYAEQMNISSKYLTNIVSQVTGHTPKTIIDQYVILQLKMHLKRTTQSIKEMAWEFHFADVSFFCRYFKKHTGLTPQQIRS